MRKVSAPSNQPAVAGGAKEKGREGVAREKATDTARGGRCCIALAPVAQWIVRRFRSPEVASSILAGALSFLLELPSALTPGSPQPLPGSGYGLHR